MIVTLDCPKCGGEVEVDVQWYGKHIPASYDSPAEYPQPECISLACENACELSDVESRDLEAEAIALAEDDFVNDEDDDDEWMEDEDGE